MTLKRHMVYHCFAHSACRTCRLYRCPRRPSSLLHVLCASYVLCLLPSLAPLITAARALRVIRVGSYFGYRRCIPQTAQPAYYLQPQLYDFFAQPYEYHGQHPVFAKYQVQPMYHGYGSHREEHVNQEEQPPPPSPEPVVDEVGEVNGGDNLPVKKEEDEAVACADPEAKPEDEQEAVPYRGAPEPEAKPEDKQEPADPREPPPAR